MQGRTKGIGGSDAPAILGVDPYRSALEVYAEKLGLIEKKEDSEAMRIGRDLEEYVALRFTEKTNKKVRKTNKLFVHPKFPWMIGHIDRLIVGEKAILECKTTSPMTYEVFEKGEYPPSYYVQCMHYLAVTGFQKAYLAILILNRSFKVYEIERDEEEIEALIEAERHFWEDHVLKGIPPEPDGSESAQRVINKLYGEKRTKRNEAVNLYGNEQKLMRYLELDEQIKILEKEKEAIKQEIQLMLGESELGVADGFFVEWKAHTRKILDSKTLKEVMPEVYERFSKEQIVRTFKVKPIF